MDRAVASTPPVASNFRDGLGERRRVVQASGDTIELLCLSRQLTAVPSFEFALRERASRLAGFRHEAFARVRSIDRLSEPAAALAVVSDFTRGVRLSHLLTPNERRPIAIDINAAQRIIRQIVNGVAALHESARDIAHGAISLERVVITANARVVIVEHVLGAALEQLRWAPGRYWKELRVVAPPASSTSVTGAAVKLGHRADIIQIGVVALSLVLGRRLTGDEGPAQFAELLASAQAIMPRGGHEPLPARLRDWIASALQLDSRRSFASAPEAQAALDPAFVTVANSEGAAQPAESIDATASPRIAVRPLPDAPAPVPRSAAAAPAVPAAPRRLDSAVAPPARHFEGASRDVQPVVDPKTAAGAMRGPIVSGDQPSPKAPSAPPAKPLPSLEPLPASPGTARRFDVTSIASSPDLSERPANPFDASKPGPERSGMKRWMVPGLAAGMVAGLAAVGLYVAQRSPAPTSPAATGTLNLTSNPPGAQVFVDRQSKGQTTPVALSLKPGAHNIELRGVGEPRTIDVNIVAGGQTSQFIDFGRAVSSLERVLPHTEPAGAMANVDDGGRALLTAAGAAPAAAPPASTATTAASVPMSGWVTVNAPVDVEIREHGSVLGTSHSDRIMVSAGRHELEIVNEILGYSATAVVQVAPGRVAPVRIEWPKGTASVNAEPWAEVWIDGDKVGETPIGNLSLPIGPHEIVFRHPELGEQRYAVSISLKAPARVSVDMRKQP